MAKKREMGFRRKIRHFLSVNFSLTLSFLIKNSKYDYAFRNIK